MKLLYIDCCVSQRGADSRTRRLAEAFLESFRRGHPEAGIETVQVETLGLNPLLPSALDERDALAKAGIPRGACAAAAALDSDDGAPFQLFLFPQAP